MRSSNETRLLPTSFEWALIARLLPRLERHAPAVPRRGRRARVPRRAGVLIPVAVRARSCRGSWPTRASGRRSGSRSSRSSRSSSSSPSSTRTRTPTPASAGSDRDDAANIATRHLLHLHYPYSTPTYLGNLVNQLPGALVARRAVRPAREQRLPEPLLARRASSSGSATTSRTGAWRCSWRGSRCSRRPRCCASSSPAAT